MYKKLKTRGRSGREDTSDFDQSDTFEVLNDLMISVNQMVTTMDNSHNFGSSTVINGMTSRNNRKE
jgi:hypothetical protein